MRFFSTALSNQSFLLNYGEDSTVCLEKCKFRNGLDESNLDDTLYYETKLGRLERTWYYEHEQLQSWRVP